MTDPRLGRRDLLATVGGVPLLAAVGGASDTTTFATWPDPPYDDPGPGSYTFPGDIYAGELDITGFALGMDETALEMSLSIRDLVVNDETTTGLDSQHVQIYIRDPDREAEGTTEARAGIDATFAASYHLRAIITPDQAVLEDPTGKQLQDIPIAIDEDTLSLSIPLTTFESDFATLEWAPLICAYSEDDPGTIMPITDTASDATIGGGEEDTPNIVDLVTPVGTRNHDVIGGTDTIPLLQGDEGIWLHGQGGDWLVTIAGEPDTDVGPGDVTYPTDIEPGSTDLHHCTIYERPEAYTFCFVMRTVEAPGSRGFTDQHLQVYVRDPWMDTGMRAARTGIEATLEDPYQHVLVVTPDTCQVEHVDGGVTDENVAVTARPDSNAVLVTVPKDVLGPDLLQQDLAVIACGHDPGTASEVRPVDRTGDDTTFTGGDEAVSNVVDCLTPPGTDSRAVLSGAPGRPVELPYCSPRRAFLEHRHGGTEVRFHRHERGTAFGPGSYEYPDDYGVEPEDMDMQWLSVVEDENSYSFTISFKKTIRDVNTSNLSHQLLQIYFSNREKEGPSPALDGTNTLLESGINQYITAAPLDYYELGLSVRNGDGNLHSDLELSQSYGYDKLNSFGVIIPKDKLVTSIDSSSISVIISGFYLMGTGVWQVREDGGETFFKSERSGAPNVLDVLTPPDISQAEALAYSEDEPAEVPFCHRSLSGALAEQGGVDRDALQEAVQHWQADTGVPDAGRSRLLRSDIRGLYRDGRAAGLG